MIVDGQQYKKLFTFLLIQLAKYQYYCLVVIMKVPSRNGNECNRIRLCIGQYRSPVWFMSADYIAMTIIIIINFDPRLTFTDLLIDYSIYYYFDWILTLVLREQYNLYYV